MSLHALIWLLVYTVLAVLTLRRCSWGIALYLLTFFALPNYWWWGEGMLAQIGDRWALIAGALLALGVLLDARPAPPFGDGRARTVLWLMLAYALNATLVHILFAANPDKSLFSLTRIWKFTLFLLLMIAAIRDRFDFKLAVYSLVIGGLYVGYEVYFNGAGHMQKGRLEGVHLGSASDANFLSTILCFSLIMAGYLTLIGRLPEKLLGVATCALLLEVILTSMSRGTMLALIGGAIVIVAGTRGRMRLYALAGTTLGVIALLLVAGDYQQEKLLQRFDTIFVDESERDGSAQSRLDYWKRALEMISDYPLGSGGEAAFKSDRGLKYITSLDVDEYRAVHNGFLDVAASWGLQGLILNLLAIAVAWRQLRATIADLRLHFNTSDAFLGCCLEAVLVVLLISTVFLSSLRGEWFFWWMALAVTLRRTVGVGVVPQVPFVRYPSAVGVGPAVVMNHPVACK